jgi:integrase
LKKLGIPHRRFHDLRHGAATTLMAAGIPTKVVAEMLGHSTPAFTATRYQHVNPAMLQQAALIMGQLYQTATANQ